MLMGNRQQTTINCYAFLDKVFPGVGMLDYTEGIYNGDPNIPFETAQQNQINYLLDEARCGPGTRLLDVGCGNGNLLAAATARGSKAIGLTISPEQVRFCRSRGLEVRLLDYREIGEEWAHASDAVIANGSIEHFVRPEDAQAGNDNTIYNRMFEILHRVIDPESMSRRLVTTTIHFVRPPPPTDLLRSPREFPTGSDSFHWAHLEKSFGGFYPRLGQFESCSPPWFELEKAVDGTEDYRLTSEAWLSRVQAAIRSPGGLARLTRRSLPVLLTHPFQSASMLACMLRWQSWNWQFRGDNAPTRLLRQTWVARPGG
jgi:cyclopropane fatty-acyl-phospholipid synthase-like methyltransferase